MDSITIEYGDKIRTWGGWYKHDVVRLDGREIGRIQTRRRNKRTDVITLGPGNTCVLGMDVAWLRRQAEDEEKQC